VNLLLVCGELPKCPAFYSENEESVRDWQMSGIGNWLIRADASRFAIGPGNTLPVDDEFLGLLGVHTLFGLEQAKRVEERVGDEGESGGARDADAVLASEGENFC